MNDAQSVPTRGRQDADPTVGFVPRVRSMADAIRTRVVGSIAARWCPHRGQSGVSGLDGRMLADIGVEPGEVKRGVRESHWLYDGRR